MCTHGYLAMGIMSVCGLAACAVPVLADTPNQELESTMQKTRLIVRADDMGLCHAVNMAFKRILEEGVCTSVSVMVTTPWLDEAVEVLQRHPEVSVGVHLTLNSEWREYRWGPVLPKSEVPSLVDQDGNFFGTRSAFLANKPKPQEVARELRAQIELALRKGLRISYLDYHMGTAVSTREFQEIVEKLAQEYQLGISQYFGETYAPSVYRAAPDEKLATALEILHGMDEPKLYLFVVHPGMNTPELATLTDLNATDVKPMAAHRQAETDMLCAGEFRKAIERQGIKLINYNDLNAAGLDRMTRPWLADPYGTSTTAAPRSPERSPPP